MYRELPLEQIFDISITKQKGGEKGLDFGVQHCTTGTRITLELFALEVAWVC